MSVLLIIKTILLADLLSGIYHWIEQRYFGEQWPIIGRWIPKPNGSHHDDQTAFLRQTYWQRNWVSCVAASLVIVVTWSLFHPPVWILLAFAYVSQANETHAWAHYRARWRIVRGLQELGLLQSPRHHAGHHTPPYLTRYCVMTDWLNPILDHLQVWRFLEWCLAKSIGLQTWSNNGNSIG